jgi:hypothetical protein
MSGGSRRLNRSPATGLRRRGALRWFAFPLIGVTLVAAATPSRADTSGLDRGGGLRSGAQAATATEPGLPEIIASVRDAGADSASSGRASPCTWRRPGKADAAAIGKAPPELLNEDGSRRVLYLRTCEDEETWIWVLQAEPRELAAASLDTVREKLPKPDAIFSPPLRSASAVVNLPQWFAVPVAQWRPVSGTAEVPGLSATVTATPRTLSFDPGDGHRPVSCRGPGPRWRPGTPEPAHAPACSYTYRDASSVAPGGRAWTARLSVRWAVAWTATNGDGGSLGTLTTTQSYAMPVREIQAVERDLRD